MKENGSIVRLFDCSIARTAWRCGWMKGALCLLLSVGALRSFSASDWNYCEKPTVFDYRGGMGGHSSIVQYRWNYHDGAELLSPIHVNPPTLNRCMPGWEDFTFLGYYGVMYNLAVKEQEFQMYDKDGHLIQLQGAYVPPMPDIYAKWVMEDGEDPEKWKGKKWPKDPILYTLARFTSHRYEEDTVEEFTRRIEENPKDYEACIFRAFARIATLWQVPAVTNFAHRSGLNVVRRVLEFRNRKDDRAGLQEPLDEIRTCKNIDDVYTNAVPVLKAAIDDLDLIPADWLGNTQIAEWTGFSVDKQSYLDYADVQLIKAILWEAMTYVTLAKGYCPYSASADKETGIDTNALAKAQTYQVKVGEMVNAFNVAQANRDDPIQKHLFMLDGRMTETLGSYEQELLDIPYWTVPIDLDQVSYFGHYAPGSGYKPDEERRKMAKYAVVSNKTLYVSFRSLFEGGVSTNKGTCFQVRDRSLWLDKEHLPDPTLGGTFPELSRVAFSNYTWLVCNHRVLGTIATNDLVVGCHAVIYKLPKGAKNNLANPATYPTNLTTAIQLKAPTLEGHRFVEWSNGGIIPAKSKGPLTFEATFETIPQEIGATTNDTVVWSINEGCLFIKGSGAMTNFVGTAPWGTNIVAVDFGSQVTNVGENAFAECKDLKTITMRGNPPALGAGNDLSGVEKILVREDALSKFESDPDWTAYKAKFESVPVGYDYANVKTLAPFLHEVRYTKDYSCATDYVLPENPSKAPAFACSAVRKGNFLGRNFDYFLNDVPTFVVRMDAAPGRLESIGVAQQFGMREDGVTNGQYTASYDQVPLMMLDGVNKYGVAVEDNVVPGGDCGELTGTNPGAPDLNISYVLRYVLDHATNAAHGVELIKSRNLVGDIGGQYYLHYMIADKDETYVVEVVTNTVVARHMDIMTNFNLNWDNANRCAVSDANSNGWAAADYPAPYDANVTTNEIDRRYTPHADGVERFMILRENRDACEESLEGVSGLMQRVKYTNLGEAVAEGSGDIAWLTEYSSESSITTLYGRFKDKDAHDELMTWYNGIAQEIRDDFARKEEIRKANSDNWQTVHSTTYDITNRMFRISVQENYEQSTNIWLYSTKPVPYIDADGVEQLKMPGFYEVVTNGMRTLENGWYAVLDDIDIREKTNLVVKGDVHLILCDGASLTVTNAAMHQAAVSVGEDASLTIYGQVAGTGHLIAAGGAYGAGIGGGHTGDGTGTVVIHGGTIKASSGTNAAGIGGCYKNVGGSVTITGGRIMAEAKRNIGSDIGDGSHGNDTPTRSCTVKISGGVFSYNVFSNETAYAMCDEGCEPVLNEDPATKDNYPWAIKPGCRVTIGDYPHLTAAWTSGDGSVTNVISGTSFGVIPGTEGVKVIFAAEVGFELVGNAVVDLGTVSENIVFGDGNEFCAPIAQLEPVPYVDADGKEQEKLAGQFEVVTSATRVLSNGWYAVLDDVDIWTKKQPLNLTVEGDVHLILCDGASLTVTNAPKGAAAVSVGTNATLTIYGQTNGTGRLTVKSVGIAAGIGGVIYGACGAIAIHGGTVTAQGGNYSAGIGSATAGIGGSVTITGGRISARSGTEGVSDIGSGYNADLACAVSISGGAYARRPQTAWMKSGYAAYLDEDEATRPGYPWVIVDVPWIPLGEPNGPYKTAAGASNALEIVKFMPSEEVAEKLGAGTEVLSAYCAKFVFEVTEGSDGWYVTAVLRPGPWAEVIESAQEATRRIPVADIAALPLGIATNLMMKGCFVPGFYYTLYGAEDLNGVPPRSEGAAGTVDVYGPELGDAEGSVTFPAVEKPSDAAGFFTIDVSATKEE